MIAADIFQALRSDHRDCREISPGTWRCHCPAHDDENPSFDVSDKDGKILVFCQAGCSQEAVTNALRNKNLWTGGNGDQAKTSTGGLSLAVFAKTKKLDAPFLAGHGVTQATGRGGKPYLVFAYRGVDGQTVEAATRFRFSMSEKPKSKRGGKPTLYGLWRLRDYRSGGEVIICEGESDALTFWHYGLPAVGIPGKALLKTINPEAFAGFSTVYVWQEPDAPELPGKVAQRLPGVTVKALIPPDGVKDVSEAHCQGLGVPELVDRLKAEAQAVPAQRGAGRQKKRPEPVDPASISFDGLSPLEARRLIEDMRLSAAQVLCVIAEKAELFHDVNHTAYAQVDGVTYPVDSHDFRMWLRGEYYAITAKGPNEPAVRDAIGVIESHAVFRGREYPVFVRLGEHEGKIYIDLADGGRAVEIGPEGWRVIKNPPVKFLRRRGMQPLPEPERGGDISLLEDYLNLPDDGGQAFELVVSWLVAAIRPSGPYPILALTGPQGSAKSTAARVLRLLVDPSSAPLRAEPKDLEQLMISAQNGWVMCYDNLSKLPSWLSDGLCRLATGGGFSTRKLYTNGEEFILEATRPVILTAINSVASSHDLADRQVSVDLPVIDDSRRKAEKGFWQRFEAARPKLLGALYDGVATALRRIDGVSLARLRRMADFALWASAAERAWGWHDGAFMAAYGSNRDDMARASIQGDPVAAAVTELMADRETWEGTPTELLEVLGGYVSDSTRKSKHWPQAANSLTRRLRKASVFLRAAGIYSDYGRSSTARLLSLSREKTVTSQEFQQVIGDDIENVTVAGGGNGDGIEFGGDDMEKIPSQDNHTKLHANDGSDGSDDIFSPHQKAGAKHTTHCNGGDL